MLHHSQRRPTQPPLQGLLLASSRFTIFLVQNANVRGTAIGIDTSELAETAYTIIVDNSDSGPLASRSTVARQAAEIAFPELRLALCGCRAMSQAFRLLSRGLAASGKRKTPVQICRSSAASSSSLTNRTEV